MNKLAKTALLGVLVLGMGVIAPKPAAAQGELGIGYQYLNFGDGADFPLGFNVDYAWPLGMNNLGLLFDLGWSRASEDFFGVDTTFTALHFGGGLRWTPPVEAAVAPYVQVVLGLQQSGYSDDFGDDSSTDFMWQPGGGVNIPLNEMWDLFSQIDFRQVFYEGESDGGFRFVVGGRVGF